MSPLAKRALYALLAVVTVVVLLFIATTLISPIRPAAWTPPAAPALAGPTALNDALLKMELLGEGHFHGAEDVELHPRGDLYGGLEDGRIIAMTPGKAPREFANTGGRPVGIDFDLRGNLWVADAVKGLLRIDPRGQVETVVTEADGKRLGFADDVDIALGGKVYFSDATIYGPQDYKLDGLETRPHGRLLVYDPKTEQTQVLLDELYFANGVAVSRTGEFLVVAETYRYRLTRYNLRGDTGGRQPFVDNLPCFPDGVSSDGRGSFWVACFAPRKALLDQVHPFPVIKRAMGGLPRSLWPKPDRHAMVIEISEGGRILRTLHDPRGEKLFPVTSVERFGDWLYFGSLSDSRVGRLKL